MIAFVALVRATWLTASSYRVRTLVSLGGLLAAVVPLYFVADAIQPIAAESIRNEGSHYFPFVLIGLITTRFLLTSIGALPQVITSTVGTGTLESLLSTPTRLPVLLAGLTAYAYLFTLLQAVVLVGTATLLGVEFAWSRFGIAMGVLFLLVLAYLPIGMISAAAYLTWRTSTPLGQGVIAGSTLLGGVYYSTSVIPSWLQSASAAFPLTYALRAIRQSILEGYTLSEVSGDVAILAGFAVVLFAVGSSLLAYAVERAKVTGTLAYY
jgi:ABC-2 type transport system permease protein